MQGKIYLRSVTIDDLNILFDWVNEPSVRKNSFNNNIISIEEHKSWLEHVLADLNTKLYILQEDDNPVGQVRLVFIDDGWKIRYSIAPVYRGQGYGKIILQLAENELICGGHIGEKLYAEVKTEDIASQCIFKKLGYSETASLQDNAYGYIKVVTVVEDNIIAPMSPRGGTVLLLSNNVNSLPLLEWLGKQVDVLYYSDTLNVSMLERIKPHLVISYNYRHIIKKEIIDVLQGNIINLHISLLPWNRGSAPNIWSFIDDTPKGVTIHKMDEGLDTGDILFQKEICFNEEKETLKSSYERLNQEIVKLLQDNWQDIYGRKWVLRKQHPNGSRHTRKDLLSYLKGKKFDYDMSIAEFKKICVSK